MRPLFGLLTVKTETEKKVVVWRASVLLFYLRGENSGPSFFFPSLFNKLSLYFFTSKVSSESRKEVSSFSLSSQALGAPAPLPLPTTSNSATSTSEPALTTKEA